MFAIRARRHTVTEEDFLKAVNKMRPQLCVLGPGALKLPFGLHPIAVCPHRRLCLHLVPQVVREYSKFSSTPKYMAYR